MIPARQCRQVCRWWFDPPGSMAHLGLGCLITIVGTVMIADTNMIIRDRQQVMGRLGLSQPDVTRPGAMRAVSGHARRLHRDGPAQSPDTVLIRRTIRDQHVSCPVLWNPGPLKSLLGLHLITDPCPLSHPGLRLITDPCPLSTTPGSMMEIWHTIDLMTSTFPEQLERRTITVIQFSVQSASVDDSADWPGKGCRPSKGCQLGKGWRLGNGCQLGKECRLGKSCRPGRAGRPRWDCRLGKDCRSSRECRSSKGCRSSSSYQHSRLACPGTTVPGSGSSIWGWKFFDFPVLAQTDKPGQFVGLHVHDDTHAETL